MSTTLVWAWLSTGCSGPSENPPPLAAAPPAHDGSAVEFVNVTFQDLYPLFLMRRIKPGPKAALWQRYVGRWVRWTGTLVSFTANGVTFKQRPETVTFDVSLWIEALDRAALKRRVKKGDRVVYIGQLDSYDDVFRTLYLQHGSILADRVAPDGGGN
jgi:hypothetical protein